MVDLHCWKGKREAIEDVHAWGTDAYWEAWVATWSEDGRESRDGTCMLGADQGAHDFTPDTEIGVAFPEAP